MNYGTVDKINSKINRDFVGVRPQQKVTLYFSRFPDSLLPINHKCITLNLSINYIC
jgi:hypothetical protein